MPGLVDKFEKSFSAVSVPYPKDTGTAEIEIKKKTIVRHSVLLFDSVIHLLFYMQEVQVAEAVAESKKKIAELEKEVKMFANWLLFNKLIIIFFFCS